MTMHRRSFLATSALGAVALSSNVAHAWQPRKRIAFLGTEVRQHSHAQHFLDRHAMGYTWGGRWQPPRFDVASVFIDQFPEGDLAKQRIAKYGLKSYPSIAEALTLGTSKLAVDGVVIIAEHGDYPVNEKGQRRYPRYAWFKEVVKVFESSGRSVPVFNDKHLSTVWEECVEMVDDSKRLGFAFLAGSSLPVTWRMPSIDMPWECLFRKVFVSAMAVWTAMIFMGWKRRSACQNGVKVAKWESRASMHCAARNSGQNSPSQNVRQLEN